MLNIRAKITHVALPQFEMKYDTVFIYLESEKLLKAETRRRNKVHNCDETVRVPFK